LFGVMRAYEMDGKGKEGVHRIGFNMPGITTPSKLTDRTIWDNGISIDEEENLLDEKYSSYCRYINIFAAYNRANVVPSTQISSGYLVASSLPAKLPHHNAVYFLNAKVHYFSYPWICFPLFSVPEFNNIRTLTGVYDMRRNSAMQEVLGAFVNMSFTSQGAPVELEEDINDDDLDDLFARRSGINLYTGKFKGNDYVIGSDAGPNVDRMKYSHYEERPHDGRNNYNAPQRGPSSFSNFSALQQSGSFGTFSAPSVSRQSTTVVTVADDGQSFSSPSGAVLCSPVIHDNNNNNNAFSAPVSSNVNSNNSNNNRSNSRVSASDDEVDPDLAATFGSFFN